MRNQCVRGLGEKRLKGVEDKGLDVAVFVIDESIKMRSCTFWRGQSGTSSCGRGPASGSSQNETRKRDFEVAKKNAVLISGTTGLYTKYVCRRDSEQSTHSFNSPCSPDTCIKFAFSGVTLGMRQRSNCWSDKKPVKRTLYIPE